MTLQETKTLAKHICRLLKVVELQIPIGRTNKGNLALRFNESDDFDIMLDAVPLSTQSIVDDENNIELKRMIEKYFFSIPNLITHEVGGGIGILNIVEKPTKKRGRPKKK